MPIPIQCSHCEAILKLKDESKDSLGKKMRCPKCKETFVAKRHRAAEPEDEVEDYSYEEVEDRDDDDYEETPRRSSRRGASGSSRRKSGKSKPAPKENQLLKTLGTIGSVVVVLLGIGLKVWLRNRARAEPAPVVAPQTPVANIPTPMPGTGTVPGSGSMTAPMSAQVPPGTAGASVISDAEFEDFGKSFEAKVTQQKGQALLSGLNVQKLLDRCLQGLELKPDFAMGFRLGAGGAFSQAIGKQVDQNLTDNGHYRFLRVHPVDNGKRVLFRMGGDAGVNYHDMVLDRRSDGQLEIVDMHVAMSGELLSETLRRAVVMAAAAQQGSFLRQLTGQLSDIEKSHRQIIQFNSLKAGEQYPAAMAVYKQLPPSVQADKTMALGRVFLAMKLGDQEYVAAITDFRKIYPNDPCIDFLSIDFHMLRKEFDQAHAAINAVEKALGGDIYLNALHANVYAEQQKWPEAKQAIATVIAAEPTLTSPLYLQAGIGVAQPDYKLVADSFRELKRKHGLDLSGIVAVPEYAGFVKSPEYQEWLKNM